MRAHIPPSKPFGHALLLMLASSTLPACTRHPLEAEIPQAVADESTAREGRGDTIVNEVAGVQVRASVDEWEGNPDVFQHVTPVRLEITNNSGTKLRINLQDIELQAADGSTYQALPLYRIGGTVTAPVVISDWDYHPPYPEGFYIAPYAAPLYDGGVLIYEGHFEYEPGYYDTYYRYWAEVALPTPYMVEHSLVEGVLPERNRMNGWVYIERIPPREELEPVYLSMALVTAEGERLGRIRLPFSVS